MISFYSCKPISVPIQVPNGAPGAGAANKADARTACLNTPSGDRVHI